MADHPDEVLRQQEAVRRSGVINMFDKRGVESVAREFGHGELADYIAECDSETYIDMAEQAAEEHRGGEEP